MTAIILDSDKLRSEAIALHLTSLKALHPVVMCGSLDEVFQLSICEKMPTLMLLNFDFVRRDIGKSTQALNAKFSSIMIVLTGGPTDPQVALGALESGIDGYFPRTMCGKTFIQAIKLVLMGERYVPAFLIEGRPPPAPPFTMQQELRNSGHLTERQIQILDMLTHGAPNKVIATRLGLQEVTVKSHLRTIYRRLGVHTRIEAARKALLKETPSASMEE